MSLKEREDIETDGYIRSAYIWRDTTKGVSTAQFYDPNNYKAYQVRFE